MGTTRQRRAAGVRRHILTANDRPVAGGATIYPLGLDIGCALPFTLPHDLPSPRQTPLAGQLYAELPERHFRACGHGGDDGRAVHGLWLASFRAGSAAAGDLEQGARWGDAFQERKLRDRSCVSRVLQVRDGEMQIALSRGEGPVAEQFLDVAETGLIAHQMGGTGMPPDVRGDLFSRRR